MSAAEVEASQPTLAGPTKSFSGRVKPAWLDSNRHMNVSWYDRVFDLAETAFFEEFGVNEGFITRTQRSFFRLERFVRHERELLDGDALEVRSFVVWSDFKRVHHFHELWNVGAGCRAAYADALSIHVDLLTRRSVPVRAEETLLPLRTLLERHARLVLPEGVLPRRNGRLASR